MWLDRRPGSLPGSESSSRPISPLPRRTSSSRGPYLTSQRPGGARGSALSLVSNDSSSSLLTASKRANGSTLKHSTTVEDAPDPEAVLARILGPSPTVAAPADARGRPITEEDLNLDFDFGGLGLRELADCDAQQGGSGAPYRPQSTEDCRFFQQP
jgi:vacuolar protein sorting-associated protein 52